MGAGNLRKRPVVSVSGSEKQVAQSGSPSYNVATRVRRERS